MILFGHPGGNPNSHHAALAHFESGRLAAFCVPWMPSGRVIKLISSAPKLRGLAQRLSRRRFSPLDLAPKVQGRLGEFRRLVLRAGGRGSEGLSYEANDWLMRTMARECRRSDVTAVHSYEDCSLWQFEEAKRLGKSCIYDMPIGYYPWWQDKQAQLTKQFAEWLPAGGLPANHWARPEQKLREMELADIVLAPSRFVEQTIREYHPEKNIFLAPYGVDLDFWKPGEKRRGTRDEGRGLSSALDARHSTLDAPSPITKNEEPRTTNDSSGLKCQVSSFASRPLRFIYAGQCAIRKGIPLFLEAWKRADLNDAHLELVGSWQLASEKLKLLPKNVTFTGPVSREVLRERFLASDVFVFPSFFEGFALASLEAMACGLAIISTEVLDGMGLVDEANGRQIQAGNLDALIEALRWFSSNREKVSVMKAAARQSVELFTWERYRACVSAAVGGL
jgi:glycosyltransferase involved in cell wall biosynthesis